MDTYLCTYVCVNIRNYLLIWVFAGDNELPRRPSSHTLTPRSHVMDRPATSQGNYSLNSPPGGSGDLYSLDNSSELTHGESVMLLILVMVCTAYSIVLTPIALAM